MRNERRKEERSKQGQTNNKAKQHSTPKAVTFPTKAAQLAGPKYIRTCTYIYSSTTEFWMNNMCLCKN